MKKTGPFFLAAAFLCVSVAWCAAPPVATALPGSIRKTMDEEYPGWALAPVNEEAKKALKQENAQHPPSLVSADFDGDGKRDYAVQIVFTKDGDQEQIVVVFLQRGDHFEEIIVQSQGSDPAIYLSSAKKSSSETTPEGQTRVVQKTVLSVNGSMIGDTSYAYQNGEFHEYKSDANPPPEKIETDPQP